VQSYREAAIEIENPGKRLQNAHEGPVLGDNGKGYLREQRMADDTVRLSTQSLNFCKLG
jgi:hypothetical protein